MKTTSVKRILSIILSVIVFVACVPVSTFGADGVKCAEDGCDGVYENGFCSADSSHYEAPLKNNSGYYGIGNAGQLYWFSSMVSGGEASINAVLTGNIIVNKNLLERIEYDENGNVTNGESFIEWLPIGYYVNSTDNAPYNGVFDGNGYTISGLYFVNAEKTVIGLFSYVETATIKNVGVVDSYFHGDNYVGGVCGWSITGNIVNCYSSSEVKGSSYVGGVCGCVDKGAVEKCHNNGKVTGSSASVGGVIGSTSTTSATVKNCYNTGEVVGFKHTGGVVGNNIGKITNGCYNTGSISGSDEHVGGVVGYNSGSAFIDNCYNSGKIKGAFYYVGGVAGASMGTIQNCYNTGEITNLMSYGQMGYAGGIAGRNYGGTISKCYNTGDVICVANAVGGICGENDYTKASGEPLVENCYNTGSIKGDSGKAGGICGINATKCHIKKCFNIGSVVGRFSYIGGVCGYASTASYTEDCYYLTGCAVNFNSVVQPGMGGSSSEAPILDVEGVTTAKTSKQFSNGEVAYLLQSAQATATPQVWGQESNTEGSHPILTNNSKYKVVKIGDGGYSVAGKGDVNGDGSISAEDYQLSLNTALSDNNTSASAEDKNAFARVDMNNDNVVDALDVAILEKMINGHS